MPTYHAKPPCPRIRWDHPLARGLIFDAVHLDGYGVSRNLVTGRSATITGTVNRSTGVYGTAGDWGTLGAANYETHTIPAWTGGALTMASSWTHRSQNNGSPYISALVTFGGGFSYGLRNGDDPPGPGAVVAAYNGTKASSSSGVIALATPALAALTFVPAGASGTLTAWLDGRALATSSATTASTSQTSVTVGRDDATNRGPDGQHHFSRIWNRALSAAEMGWLRYDPWAIYRPRRAYFPLAGGAIALSRKTPWHLLTRAS